MPSILKNIYICWGTRIFKVNYSIDSQILDRVQTIRDLGVIYDSSLSFDQRTKSVVTKCLEILGFIRNVTLDFRNVSTLVYLYKSLLLPVLTYSSSVWFPQTATDFYQLISIEHKFLRFASRKIQCTISITIIPKYERPLASRNSAICSSGLIVLYPIKSTMDFFHPQK